VRWFAVQFSGISPAFWLCFGHSIQILDIETLKRNKLLKREAQQTEVDVFLKLPFDFKKCLYRHWKLFERVSNAKFLEKEKRLNFCERYKALIQYWNFWH